jgi:hypothetical protein
MAIVIVGGGISGLATAFALCKQGFTNITYGKRGNLRVTSSLWHFCGQIVVVSQCLSSESLPLSLSHHPCVVHRLIAEEFGSSSPEPRITSDIAGAVWVPYVPSFSCELE